MKYEVGNKILSLKRLNNRDATDRVSVFIATGKLHARQNSVLKKITRKRCFSFVTENMMKSTLSRKVTRLKKIYHCQLSEDRVNYSCSFI